MPGDLYGGPQGGGNGSPGAGAGVEDPSGAMGQWGALGEFFHGVGKDGIKATHKKVDAAMDYFKELQANSPSFGESVRGRRDPIALPGGGAVTPDQVKEFKSLVAGAHKSGATGNWGSGASGGWGAGPDGPVSQSELAAFKDADQASGGPKNGVDTPTVRAPGRQVSTGGRGNSRTKTSPSTTTGPSPVTAAPRSSDPNDSDTSMDPSLKEMKGLLDHYKDGSRDGVDLSPMMALADSWGGSHLLKGYERPMNEHDREKLRLGLTEQMAKRQSDLEWHRQRMQMNRDTIQGRGEVADTNAGAKTDVQEMRGHAQILHDSKKPGVKPKPAPAGGIDPDEKALQGFYGKDLEGIVRNNYSGDPKNIGPAKSALHQAAWAQTQKGASDPRVIQHYPGLQDPDDHVRKAALRQLYSDSVQDQVYLRPKLPGMKWRGPRAAEGGGEEGGEGGN